MIEIIRYPTGGEPFPEDGLLFYDEATPLEYYALIDNLNNNLTWEQI